MEFPVHSKALIVLAVLAGSSRLLAAAASAPVDCTHLMAWTLGGTPEKKITKILQARGSQIAVSPATERELRTAGATTELINAVRNSSSTGSSACPAELAKAGNLIRAKKYEEA